MRFHVLGVPHTASNADYLACAFTQKVVKLCTMLKRCGHHVIHYGNVASQVACDEHVSVTDEIPPPADYLGFDTAGPLYHRFHANTIEAIAARKQPRDFLLCAFGWGHKPVADVHSDMIVVESGIGYAGGHFAPFKVFESYAMMHAYYGLAAVATPNTMRWYDVVIPNAFEPDDFTCRKDKDGYLLFLGRAVDGKGLHVAQEIADAAGMRLAAAGHGTKQGVIDAETRRLWLANASALIAPSLYAEPFCGVVTEAHLSGTPTITTDWGAFAENNLHGVTGYRCRTCEQFVWAAKHAGEIRAEDCRVWGENFSLDRVAEMYDEYFASIMAISGGKGWYEPNNARRGLDWLRRDYPTREE